MALIDPVYFSFVNISMANYKEIWNYYPQLIGLEEEWLPITDIIQPGVVNDKYLISNYGRVYDIPRNVIKPQFLTNCNYLRVNLAHYDVPGSRAHSVHRIVMKAFNPIDNPELFQVNHKDEIKTHDWLWNLEWLTCSDNRVYSINTGLIKVRGEDNYNASITNEQADQIGYLIANSNMTYPEISEYLQVPKKVVENIANGNSWVHVCEKYNLDKIYRNPPAASIQQIHAICRFIQDYTKSNIIGFGQRLDFYRKAAISAGMNPESPTSIRLIERLYYKLTHKDICNQYDY